MMRELVVVALRLESGGNRLETEAGKITCRYHVNLSHFIVSSRPTWAIERGLVSKVNKSSQDYA